MDKVIKKLPLPISGLMLALAAGGNLVLSYGSIYRNILGILSFIILVLIAAKVITAPKAVAEGMNNPVVASVLPTFSMGLMLLSTYIKPLYPALAFGIWIFALLLHVLLIVIFTVRYILKFDIKKVFPSYFVVYVGIVVASVTAPVYDMALLGRYLFWFGLASYLILLPVILYRTFAIKSVLEPAMPTIAIFAAPASLCLAGYMNSFQEKSLAMVAFLSVLALMMTFGVILYLPKLLKSKFYPSFSAFTFPFVISGIAMKLTNGYLIKAGKGFPVLAYIVKFEEILAMVMVFYILARYISFLTAKDEISAVPKQAKA
ncbi:TDT family transporter [Lutispora saccharofermentans]|uniref:TDT family transporter n=1 Tax=Lutispora saccharofermentans TaxID=3024236 RepID=A0ABT1NMS0_9FIRM|nr:TDT family transporter [Lutispora saccharofermentans]MCQ1531226.1 TDT family transporter [Lutispora saccharofermentans]